MLHIDFVYARALAILLKHSTNTNGGNMNSWPLWSDFEAISKQAAEDTAEMPQVSERRSLFVIPSEAKNLLRCKLEGSFAFGSG